jgi:hypothetical protein
MRDAFNSTANRVGEGGGGCKRYTRIGKRKAVMCREERKRAIMKGREGRSEEKQGSEKNGTRKGANLREGRDIRAKVGYNVDREEKQNHAPRGIINIPPEAMIRLVSHTLRFTAPSMTRKICRGVSISSMPC